ncbi:metallophosphoesteras-like protein [Ampelomyces quisqualis]|uniref:Metallophosphoesteras-like protein n=1 Tax=Ampelomyces quisqualis TaxID=50730 RepID=A0A6A5QNP5_AMPQU|nr:metallophosphoesteras-like protein [Ampelomyces quisqualis]
MDPLVATAVAADATPTTVRGSPPPVVQSHGRLFAIGDIHLSFKGNREALDKLLPHRNDDLILCGDVGESIEHCRIGFAKATECFRRVWWVPGNHELYTLPSQQAHGARGQAKYMECVAAAREYGVLTPEDDYALWEGEGGPVVVAPVFTLYDYSFRPAAVRLEDALAWAREQHIEATDEHLLHPDPYASRIEWCHALVDQTEAKLAAAVAAHPNVPLVIAGHWPLREDVVTLVNIPRFSLWCGTKKTADWHTRYNAKVVVSGHLHIRRTDWRDGTRFEEVSLGYPRQWQECQDRGLDINDLLREILPGPATPPEEHMGTVWRRFG